MSWARWLTSVIPVVGRQRQEGQKFQGQSRPPRSVWATENPGEGGEKKEEEEKGERERGRGGKTEGRRQRERRKEKEQEERRIRKGRK